MVGKRVGGDSAGTGTDVLTVNQRLCLGKKWNIIIREGETDDGVDRVSRYVQNSELGTQAS